MFLPILSALGGPLINLLSGAVGLHHVANVKAGLPNAIKGAVEGFGGRGVILILGTAYVLNAGCRAATNSWLASAAQAARDVVGL